LIAAASGVDAVKFNNKKLVMKKVMNTDNQSVPRVGVVLSSGGIRGAYAHTGFLLALQQLDISVSAVSGCSAGALVGGVFASGKNMQEWSEAMLNIKQKEFWTPSWAGFLWSLLLRKWRGYTGMSSTDPALKFCQQQLQVKNFNECKIPFSVLAKNLATGKKKVFTQGELAPCIVASAAIPVFYKPVKIGDDYYCDGALIDLAPTDTICCTHNLDVLIVHHVAQRSAGRPGLEKVMHQPWTLVTILNMLLYQQRPWYLSDKPLIFRRCPCGCDAIIIVIEPDLPELAWPITDTGSEIMQAAHQQTNALLEPHLHAIKQDALSMNHLIEDVSVRY